MPRPKHSRATASRRNAPPPSTSATEAGRPPLATKPNAPNVNISTALSSDMHEISGKEKEVKRKRPSEAATAGQGYAAALDASRHRRDNAMSRLENLTSTTSDDTSDIHTQPIRSSRRVSSATVQSSRASRSRRATGASGLELDDDLFAALDDSIDANQDDEDSTQARSGHYSTDTSSLNASLFKRRPRASSVARDTSIRPSSRGAATPLSSTFSFGLFRRRAREPSILGTAQKERSYRRAGSSQVSQASGDEAEDDFVPDAAGTPGDAPQRSVSGQPESSREPSPVAMMRKRKSQEAHGSSKRRSVENDEIRQSIEAVSSPASSVQPSAAVDRPVTPDPDDPDMAPPLSSGSSEGSPVAWPSLDALTHRVYIARRAPSRARKTPDLADDVSDMSSPPSLTHSPNYRAPPKTRQKPRAPSPKWTTKDLASLLPRRRIRARSQDPFALASDDEGDESDEGLGNDEDELSYMDARPARKRSQRAKARPSAKSGKRTYGREAEEETEGEDGNDDAAGSGDEEAADDGLERVQSSDELAKAAQKFKEVDQWEMSFEEVTEESSSPVKDAR
ncbi:hypothetical protein GQ53DRAFT_748249 [Thozetella sp. PMI_491]|nr:hypothetical protein GQ53DRAFT_748249 [Thozetella sp. PMI_491]